MTPRKPLFPPAAHVRAAAPVTQAELSEVVKHTIDAVAAPQELPPSTGGFYGTWQSEPDEPTEERPSVP